MSSTREWMRRRDDARQPVRPGPPLAGVIVWIFALVIVGLGALAFQQPFG